MTEGTTTAIKLYGTEESVVPMRTLHAGPLVCKFDQGALRFIKVHGKEAIRNIAFVVRDKDWGTCQPELSNIKVDQQPDAFTVEFDARCTNANEQIQYKASITGSANGALSFNADYTATTEFVTNRTGFVVLHPVQGVAGNPVLVEHVNGDIKKSVFPELVDPLQPFKDIRALTHDVLPGVGVCCRMTGDTFEMEDHRQWNDASYKTYVRPIGLPWPYTIKKGDSHQQSVTLSIISSEDQDTPKAKQKDVACEITVQEPDNPNTMPRIGLGLEPQHISSAQSQLALLSKVGMQQLVFWYELNVHNAEQLSQAAALCKDTDSECVLHAVIPDDNYRAELASLAAQCKEANFSPTTISITPKIYLSSITPGAAWPDVTALADIYDEVRSQFPGVTVGGGMLAFFPELNRHRPPTEHLDYITHASNTITHASDDITVTENLEAIPYIIKTCRSFANGKPYHVGPSSIGMRFNPYGSKTMENPDNKRIAMARMEPRQRGLINAAWTVGYAAHMARGGIDCINLHAPTGEFGIIYHPQQWSQPGFDHTGKTVYPAYHPVAGFASAAGSKQLTTYSSRSREVEAVAYRQDNQTVVWIANLTQEEQAITVNGLPATLGQCAILSLETFDQCTENSHGFDTTTIQQKLPDLVLGPFSVIRITV